MTNYKLIFDDVILKQLKRAGKNKHIRDILSKILDKLERLGCHTGKLIDNRLSLYEVKLKKPPIRLYYKCNETSKIISVFEYEMKTSQEKQQKTITILKEEFEKMKLELETLRNSELYERLLEFEKNIKEGKIFTRKDLGF